MVRRPLAEIDEETARLEQALDKMAFSELNDIAWWQKLLILPILFICGFFSFVYDWVVKEAKKCIRYVKDV